MIPKPEILAPAGSQESLLAAVRCGANAVYLGGKSLNARRSASNFDDDALESAVKYCHGRGVSVYLTLNTVVFDNELEELAIAVQKACELGVDAVIVQDLAAAAIIKKYAPTLPLHASTQMSVHTLDDAKQLEAMGFSRVVLARELSRDEITRISKGTSLSLECFVHGALCMCVSGQCYFSAMLGERSGNRGLCAQPCRLPMTANKREYCLSLKDLSLIERVPELVRAGVCSLKIEGRMKRPEYVAAAVTACKQAIDGLSPDMETLAGVFSRDGFTSGYFDGKTGAGMFGARRHEDVLAASPKLLAKLSDTYKNETQSIPVTLDLKLEKGIPSSLTASDGSFSVTVTGDAPQDALTSPTTAEKAAVSLSKTGGTPFLVSGFTTAIGDGLMLPASSLNALRRDALEKLLSLREQLKPHSYGVKSRRFSFFLRRKTHACGEKKRPFQIKFVFADGQALSITGQRTLPRSPMGPVNPISLCEPVTRSFLRPRSLYTTMRRCSDCAAKPPDLRVRLSSVAQLTEKLLNAAELVSLPAVELLSLNADILRNSAHKLAAELPRVLFSSDKDLLAALDFARKNGVSHAVAGNIGSIKTARDLGFTVHGGYSLNITNTVAINEYDRLGLCDATVSFELSCRRISALGGDIPRGILAYGHLPLMAVRNCPVNACENCKNPVVTDRLGNKFPVVCGFGTAEILNCVPLYLADRLSEFSGIDFYTLYFTTESVLRCDEILGLYLSGGELDGNKTRGLYFRSVK